MSELITQAIARIKLARGGQAVSDWRKQIRPGSRWFPGCPGDPDCEVCGGTGYVRLDLPNGHPDFGKIFLCECVNRPHTPKTWQNVELPLEEHGQYED